MRRVTPLFPVENEQRLDSDRVTSAQRYSSPLGPTGLKLIIPVRLRSEVSHSLGRRERPLRRVLSFSNRINHFLHF